MINEVLINKDGVLEVKYHGDQTEESIKSLIGALNKELVKITGKVDYIIDLTDVGKTTLASRITVVSNLKKLRINRQAVFGGNVFTKKLMNLMMRAVSKGDNIKYFDTREDAVAWVKK